MTDLTPEQQEYVLANWKTKSLIEMTRELSGDPNADGRHKLGRSIKEFLSSKGFEAKTSKFEAKGPLELTPEQVEFCKLNADKMRPLEITRLLFNDVNLTPLSREFKAVFLISNQLEKTLSKQEDEPVEEEQYKAPTSLFKLLPRVNRYVPNPKNENQVLFPDINKIGGQDEKNLKALLSYMNVPRFSYQAKQFIKKIDREIFESTFIGMTWDKADLLREEVEQYISLATEIVQTAQIDRHIQRLDAEIEEALEGDDDGKKKLSMTMVELVNTAREKLDKSKERQKKLIENLVDSRAERLKKRIQANSSILNLVDAWADEKQRLELLAIVELQKKAESDDIEKLTSMSDVIALIAGISKDEALN